MNGGQDLGGMMGFGPISPEPDEPVFHGEWEKRVFALTLAMGATRSWTLDASRHARESLPPGQYMTSTYYQIWLEGIVRLMRERGIVTESELRDGRMTAPAKPLNGKLMAKDVVRVLSSGGPTERESKAPARFSAGDRVRARNLHPVGHTRLPGYLRGRTGTIVAAHGAHVYPDSNATGEGENPQWLYTVRFSARELWGEARNASDTVNADLWEPYLESV